jgi:hypothetical protein
MVGLFAFALGACGDDGTVPPADAHPPVDAADGGAIDADAGANDSAVDADGAVDAATDASVVEWTGPLRLSETGLWSDPRERTLAEGVLTYATRWPLWSDGSDKRRYLLLPPGTTIDSRDPDGWTFPIGTRAWKDFVRDGVLVETRYVEKSGEGDFGWRYVAYIWDADGDDAFATPDGLADARGTLHDVPSQADCRNCHRGGSDFLLGVGTLQLAFDGGLLATLASDGLLSDPPPPAAALIPPGDTLVQETLGYLHANCGHCHNERHPLASIRALRLWLPVGVETAEETPTYLTAIGTPSAHFIEGTTMNIVPGRPDDSQLWVRMGPVDADLRMPQVGRELPDPMGRDLVSAFIESLSP